jgi:hypothetical protein
LANKNLYALKLNSIQAIHAFITHTGPDLHTWHRRLDHANYQAITDMLKGGLIEGVGLHTLNVTKCDAYILGKQTKTPVPKIRGDESRATKRLEKIWVDLTGPMDVKSHTGNSYIMNIVDDFSGYPWSIPLKNKSEALPKLQEWQCARELETGLQVMKYRTDNGELKSSEMANWLATKGTIHEFTAPHTSVHIGRVERMHRTLMGKARSMRIYAGLPTHLWDEFYLTATHLHAKTTTRSLSGKHHGNSGIIKNPIILT